VAENLKPKKAYPSIIKIICTAPGVNKSLLKSEAMHFCQKNIHIYITLETITGLSFWGELTLKQRRFHVVKNID